jgi:RNA polymerase sigma factor (sigma-70 family)
MTGECQSDQLARRYEHRVGFFARKVQRSFMLGSSWNDELVSAGYWGLFKALQNRRPEAHENELSAYVSQRIHGAVIDAARNCINQRGNRELYLGALGQEACDELDLERVHSGWQVDTNARDPEMIATEASRSSAIDAALMCLEAAERQIVRAYMEGASLSEIARDQHVSLATLRVRFERAARKLRAFAPALRRVLLDQDVG